MTSHNIIFAQNENGQDIYSTTITKWIKNENKLELADMFFNRFYDRYLKPFDYESIEYKKSYKNGFAIMANCCLLIETFVSYTNIEFKDNNYKSERSFGYFFITNKEFNVFSKGGLKLENYEKQQDKYLNNRGIPRDFYKNVRCGIIHNGETKNNWKIVRNGTLFNSENKSINATKFLKNLLIVLNRFRESLIKADFNSDQIWKTYKSRLEFMIEKSDKN